MKDISSKYIAKKYKKNNNNIEIKIKKKNIYNIEKKLLQDIPNLEFSKIFVCIYKIKKFHKNLIMPSLEYLLYKDKNELFLPFFNVYDKQNNLETVIKNYSLFLLKKINNNCSIQIKGYLTIEKNLFCFLQVKNKLIENIKIKNIENKEPLWWTTLNEIYNGKLINYKINKSVKYIFNNNKFLYIFNKKNIYREQTLFICAPRDKILNIIQNNFIENNKFKPLYFCIKNAIKTNIKNPVLIRCSIFSKKYITKPTKINKLFRILPNSFHFINFTSNNNFKIK